METSNNKYAIFIVPYFFLDSAQSNVDPRFCLWKQNQTQPCICLCVREKDAPLSEIIKEKKKCVWHYNGNTNLILPVKRIIPKSSETTWKFKGHSQILDYESRRPTAADTLLFEKEVGKLLTYLLKNKPFFFPFLLSLACKYKYSEH